jgi:tRNA-2-methylthio-N6-dimethylallyladenosine synthase
MKRLHTVDLYKKKIDRIRKSPRNNSVTTDIIVGFPGETDEDFRQTIDLFEYCKYDSAFFFKYSPRFGTPSFKMKDDVSDATKTERFTELHKLQRRLQAESLSGYNGKTVSVLAEKFSTKSGEDLSGHTTCHRLINFKGDQHYLGQIIEVRVTEAKSNSLYGEVV